MATILLIHDVCLSYSDLPYCLQYKSMGFPPAAARQAATAFSNYNPKQNAGLSLSPPSSHVSPVVTAPETKQDDAQAAHFAATQALYKSMGFPPRAAKEAATTFSGCHQSFIPAAMAPVARAPTLPLPIPSMPQTSYMEALNKAIQQSLAGNVSASAASASVQPARMQQTNIQAPVLPSGPGFCSRGVEQDGHQAVD